MRKYVSQWLAPRQAVIVYGTILTEWASELIAISLFDYLMTTSQGKRVIVDVADDCSKLALAVLLPISRYSM